MTTIPTPHRPKVPARGTFPLQHGWYSLTIGEYLRVQAVSRTTLHTLLSTCPAAVDPNRPREIESSAALDFGDALHRMVFEGARLIDFAIAEPGVTRRQNAGKAHEAEARARNLVPLTVEEALALPEILDRVTKSPAGLSLIQQPKALREATVIWEDEETGIFCKAKLDLLSLTAPGYILDLKTTADASPRKFAYSCRDYGYTMQAGMYLSGVEAALGPAAVQGYVIVAVEKEHPYRTEWYDMDAHIEPGKALFREALAAYARCLEANEWPPSATLPGDPFQLTRLPLL